MNIAKSIIMIHSGKAMCLLRQPLIHCPFCVPTVIASRTFTIHRLRFLRSKIVSTNKKGDEPIVERERAGFRLFSLISFGYGKWLLRVVSFGPPR